MTATVEAADRARTPDPRRYFNSASLGLVPSDVIAASTGPIDRSWDDLIAHARHSIGSLLAPRDDRSYRYDPNKSITLFMNTTSAFARILSQIDKDYAGSNATLLTTDLEYPGCVAAIDDSWSGPVVMARVADRLLTNAGDPDRLLHNALVRAYNFVKPRVVLVSHVMRTTGQAISTKTLKYFREANPRVVVVLDGSQAIGNVVVTEEVLAEVDFYIASGHKWLCGMTTSGFVWQREPNRWKVADPGQSLAHDLQLGGAGNAAAWSSLIRSIDDMVQEHPKTRLRSIAHDNRALGGLFRAELKAAGADVDFITPYRHSQPPSGLVTVGLPRNGEAIVEALARDGYDITVLGYEQVRWRSKVSNRFLLECDPTFPAITAAEDDTATHRNDARTEVRLCFHHWHTEDDVRMLVQTIAAAVAG